MSDIGRRQFLSGIAGTAAFTGSVASYPTSLASAKETTLVPLRTFSASQADTYSAWCDLLATGAAKAGVAEFVDKYISEPYGKSLLLLRYFQGDALRHFYVAGIGGIDQESQARFKKSFLQLDNKDRLAVVDAAVHAKTVAWTKPDPNFFYFISRSDAVDVVYGTEAGFAALGIPYVAHIPPVTPW